MKRWIITVLYVMAVSAAGQVCAESLPSSQSVYDETPIQSMCDETLNQSMCDETLNVETGRAPSIYDETGDDETGDDETGHDETGDDETGHAPSLQQDTVNPKHNPHDTVNPKLTTHDIKLFKPDPHKAWLMAMAFPGVGQIYNRQYWKLPIVYGGLMGFVYAISWNNKNYQDYKSAYFDIVRDAANDPQALNPDSWSQSWQDFISANANPANYLNNAQFQSNLKSGKDFYRRYRDMSIIFSVVLYLICVADSYVDAQMFDFDVSPDLSMRIAPEIKPATFANSHSFGLSICMTF